MAIERMYPDPIVRDDRKFFARISDDLDRANNRLQALIDNQSTLADSLFGMEQAVPRPLTEKLAGMDGIIPNGATHTIEHLVLSLHRRLDTLEYTLTRMYDLT